MLQKLRFLEVSYLLGKDFLKLYGRLTPKQQALALAFMDSSAKSEASALSIEEIFNGFKLTGSLATLRRDLKVLLLGGILEEFTIPNEKNKPVLAYSVTAGVMKLIKEPGETAFVDKVKHEKEKAEIQEFKLNQGNWAVDKPSSYANSGKSSRRKIR
jgi:hypothetical protein